MTVKTMKPNKQLIENLTKDTECVAMMNHGVSAAYLLRSLARMYEDDVEEGLKKHHCSLGEIKQKGRFSDKAFEDYRKYVETFFEDAESVNIMSKDFERLYKIVDEALSPIIKKFIG